MRSLKRVVILSTLLMALAAPAFAGELALLGGYAATTNPHDNTYSWELQYMEGLGEHFAYSIAYLNQGHFISHHRDANTASLWARTSFLNKHLTLGVGAGGLFFYDTIIPPGPGQAQDFHGWGTIVNVAATYYTDSRWFAQLQGNWVKAGNSFDTVSALVGIGYQLDAPPQPGPDVRGTKQRENTSLNELTLMGGQAVVNIPEANGKSAAVNLEYRRGIWRYLTWTVGWLYEGSNDLTERYGGTTQLWLEKEFLDDSITLGAGFGAYSGWDQRRSPKYSKGFIAELVSMSGSFRLGQHWDVRATWDRTITSYDRDSDIFLGGIGYRF
ncbi:hypothetical protein [Geomonas sp.]|uniref:hypothetical protein n=1 Tax=Geomonas sp. TaxID=2651584 RepID=UPI002B49B734|nr:hypothetical protein [Geomonas sp.]HJV36192.1 hypothetical protein [Geomonas sp.]